MRNYWFSFTPAARVLWNIFIWDFTSTNPLSYRTFRILLIVWFILMFLFFSKYIFLLMFLYFVDDNFCFRATFIVLSIWTLRLFLCVTDRHYNLISLVKAIMTFLINFLSWNESDLSKRTFHWLSLCPFNLISQFCVID